jgi:hypothetical protein
MSEEWIDVQNLDRRQSMGAASDPFQKVSIQQEPWA